MNGTGQTDDRPRYEEMCSNRQNHLHCKKWFRQICPTSMIFTPVHEPVNNCTSVKSQHTHLVAILHSDSSPIHNTHQQ